MRDPRDGYTADEMNAMVRGETTPQELLEAGVGQDAAALDRSGDTEPASGTSAAIVRHVPRAHLCPTPGWRQRRRLDIGDGTIWRCACGQEWKWCVNYAGQGWWRA